MPDDIFLLGMPHPLTFALAFVPMLINLGILIHVGRHLPRDRISALFSLYVVCLITWQLYDCMVRTALTEDVAAFWRRLLFIGQLLAFPTGIHFALLYGGREKAAESPLVLSALYLPALLFVGSHYENLIEDPTWGFISAPDPSLRGNLMVLWATSQSVLMLVFLGLAIRRWRGDPARKLQAQVMFGGMVVPVGLGLIFEAIFPNVLHIRQWPLTSTTLSTFSIATVVALTRLKLFDVSSSTAATAVLEVIRDTLFIATPDAGLLFANREAAQRFGIDRDHVRAHAIADMFPDAAAWKAFQTAIWNPTILGAGASAYETTLKQRDGTALPVLVSTAPVPVSRWGAPGVLVLAKDVSKLKETEAELQQAMQAAEAANKAKSSFLANMSHELRTPLNAILGYSELIQELCQDDGYVEIVPDLKKIHHSAAHLLSLINDVLDLSKIEAGRMEVVPEEFDLGDLVREVKTMASPLAERRNNSLIVQCAPDVGAMRQDKVKIRQILLNLLSNACKFTEGGTVSVVVTVEQADRLRLAVVDTGLGMSEEQVARLFQRFSQVHADKNKYGGTGLGLVLCKRFAEMLGGDAGVTSEPGKGSTFFVVLPRRYSEPAVA